MRDYPLKLSDYEIDGDLYRELLYFCRQHRKRVKELTAIRGGFNDVRARDMPRGSDTSDPTARRAERAMRLSRDVEAVEQAAIAADSGIYQFILKSVTEQMRYEYLPCPCGRRQFFEARRRFFWELANKLGKLR